MNYLEQLRAILRESGWSQEQLAHELGVSFAALNAWLRERSVPRAGARLAIEQLYAEVAGTEQISGTLLADTKRSATDRPMRAADFVQDRQLLDVLTLYLTYHTNTIEGSTMTLADVGEVLFEHKVLTNRTAVEQAEARNHQAALEWVLGQLASGVDVLDEAFVWGIHLRLMNGIMSDAGQYRRHAVRILGSRTATANWLKVPVLMAELLEHANTPSGDTVAHLARVHATFEKIHPFSDGNGRTGRLLLLVMALRAGVTPPIIAKERKRAYYKYLERAQTQEDYVLLELFVAESVLYAAKLFIDGRNG